MSPHRSGHLGSASYLVQSVSRVLINYKLTSNDRASIYIVFLWYFQLKTPSSEPSTLQFLTPNRERFQRVLAEGQSFGDNRVFALRTL